MDRYPSTVASTTRVSALTTNKVLRNTYLLLSATLAFSAVTAGVSMALNLPHFGLITLVVYFGLLFATYKTRDSAWGLVWVFALTGFLGLTLGPLLNAYLTAFSNGPQLFLTVGIIGAFVLGLVAYFFNMPTLALAVSGMFVIAMAGLILYQTSAIIRGEETNYIMATVTFYVSIYNLFTSLLHLLGATSGDD
jgi:modulator of FtsH protease